MCGLDCASPVLIDLNTCVTSAPLSFTQLTKLSLPAPKQTNPSFTSIPDSILFMNCGQLPHNPKLSSTLPCKLNLLYLQILLPNAVYKKSSERVGFTCVLHLSPGQSDHPASIVNARAP